MDLKFPPLKGGVVPGINDAGIETFEGDFARNVIRECAQNSLDAAVSHDEPVKLTISAVLLEPGDLPFLPRLVKVLKACGKYWESNEKARKFFQSAVKLAQAPHLHALKVGDFGTTGVDGSDDDITSRWFGLVKSRGVSNQKDAESGGAYGIGKDAPLALSAFRTVLYSTRTLDGDVALQGVCRLVSHKGDDGELTQGTGFIGDFDSRAYAYRAIRDTKLIPTKFQRKQPGLDVWILGSRLDEDWSQPFVRSALANFWPAISSGKISFVIGRDTIDQSNLGNWIERERHDTEVAEARPFYLSLVNQHAKTFATILPTAGESTLHLLLAKADLPKQICMVRRTGMVIDFYAPRVGFLPFSGLYVCKGIEGNRLLKSLEPPRHDRWNPARAEDPRAQDVLKEIKEWIRQVIKEQIPHVGEDEFNESDVPPDLLENEPENPLTEDAAVDPETDLGGSPKDVAPPVQGRIRTRAVRKKTGDGKKGAGADGEGVENPGKGDGEKTGGRKRQSGEVTGDTDLTPKLPTLTTRAFCEAGTSDTYEIILRSDGDYEGAVWLEALGDDGSSENIALQSAELVGEGPVDVEQAKLKDLRLTAHQTCRLRVRLKRPGKYSLRASLS
jgi:hypothetical protein